MARQLKKRAIEKELKFLANFEVYGVLLFVGLVFRHKVCGWHGRWGKTVPAELGLDRKSVV